MYRKSCVPYMYITEFNRLYRYFQNYRLDQQHFQKYLSLNSMAYSFISQAVKVDIENYPCVLCNNIAGNKMEMEKINAILKSETNDLWMQHIRATFHSLLHLNPQVWRTCLWYLPPQTLIKIQDVGVECDSWFGNQIATLVVDILEKR